MKSKEGFLQLKRKAAEKLIRTRPTAFLLLTQIALRAKRTNEVDFNGLEIGEALIGDFKWYGGTSQIYRNDKHFLKINKLATFRPTNRGTVAKLINMSVFDINPEGEELASNQESTISQQSRNNQGTTNNNVINKEINNKPAQDFSFSESEKTPEQLKKHLAELDEITDGLRRRAE